MLDIPDLMRRLADERPVFHSEADFQHALAWLVQRAHPEARIRLERPIQGLKKGRARLDLWVGIGDRVEAIELKYQTVALSVVVDGETFDLAKKSAEDNLGYGFLSDVAGRAVGGGDPQLHRPRHPALEREALGTGHAEGRVQ